jgi:hypothetical protein
MSIPPAETTTVEKVCGIVEDRSLGGFSDPTFVGGAQFHIVYTKCEPLLA